MNKVIEKAKNSNIKDLDTMLKQSFIKSYKDEDFKKMVSRLNIDQNKLYKYTSKLNKTVEDLKKCKNCKGLVECKNEIPGFIYYPEIDGNILNFSHIACKYKRKSLKETKYYENIYSFDEPIEILNAKMKDIYTDDKNRIEVIKWLKSFITNFDKNKKQKGLYLHGSFGGGKTYLVFACFNELAKRGVDCAIVYWPEFLRKLKTCFNLEDNSFDNLFNTVKDASLLLIDDIGAENTTAWSRDEILGPILQHRMLSHLPTFFTSNLSLIDLEKHFSITTNSVDKVKSRRILERIKELSEEIKMVTDNKRK